MFDEDLLLKYRWAVSERTNGHQREEYERDDNHPGKYRHEDRPPFTIFRAMRGTRPPILLPSFEAEDLAHTTRK
jgi:hypothetical protein